MSKLTIVVFCLFGFISACVGQSGGVLQVGQQCDEIAPVVTNFVLASFAGTWYDIESTESSFQGGTCNTATYSASTTTATGFNIENTQVQAGVLQRATGSATLQTGIAQGTAKFDVTISGSAAVPFWILDTDFTTFALVYSCVNEGANRRVRSWKLGREKGPLPTAATDRINTRISQVAALTLIANGNQYIVRDHSVDACSHFVDLDGQCDTTITGTSAFNAAAFQGTWYEFARYRQETQSGKCNRAQYTAGANGIVNVQNRQVINEALNTISGVAFGVAGRPGVLQVNFDVGGDLRSQNLVVLATDNNNYALLYSCSNLENNRRRIGSWQLRKQLEPLNAANLTLINAAINANNDLQSNFYLETSQSDADCFYYPEWTTLPSTIDLPGPCNTTITGTTNFNAATFVGDWYEYARYPQPTQAGQCNRASYSAGVGGAINIQNSQVNAETLSTISGTATAVAGQNGVLRVVLGNNEPQDLYVLATDNTNYALLYSCRNIDATTRRVSSWKLTRQPGLLSDAANTAINTVVANTQGLRQNYYQTTSQADAACFHYPQLDPLVTGTIDLPGPCNTTITGIAGFNADRFVGQWYEVARYPQPTQTGQCNRASYAIGTGGVITVQNSQVINESLSTISGTATVVAGQSGLLQVSLVTSTGTVVQPLYVLDTDYENYALLYTCTNIAGNQRRVGSWQMSKTLGPLNAAGNAAIASKIETTQGLRTSYYLSTSQSDAACFYYPEWTTLPATIDLPGPCNTSITGAANFNAATFAGTWFDVARYPQPTQSGQCNRATYSVGTGGVINVQNSQVNAETLSTISGTATAVAQQNGVLQVTLTTSTGPVTQNLYVLATDNTNYALLYSCTNLAGNNRRVGSWKMSKQSATLSEAANAVINTFVENTQGLRQNYYTNTNQSDAACFHYPATQGETVIIPGRCDTTITGPAAFNNTAFSTGIWYHIQRYNEVGNRSCIATRLTLQGDEQNTINVNSVELVGNVENRTEGRAWLSSTVNGQFILELAGSEVNRTVTIVSTNNNQYAIAYTCENSGTDNREVGIWLLSRDRTWPAAGATALTSLVQTRQEFTNREGYFKAIPHNDDCPEPSSAFLFKSSLIVIFVCTILQFVW